MEDKALIAFKKMFGKVHTSPNKALLANEALGTGFSGTATALFAQELPVVSKSANLYTVVEDVVEKVRLPLRAIAGTDTTGSKAGIHGFAAFLPDDYFTAVRSGGSNIRPVLSVPAYATWDWAPGMKLAGTNGGIQIVPVSIGGDSYTPTLYDANDQVIEPLAANDWVLYEYGGVVYQDVPPADSAANPAYIDCWIYIGKMQSEVTGFVSTAKMSRIMPDNPDSLGWSGVGTLYVAENGVAGGWNTSHKLIRFGLDTSRLSGYEVFDLPVGWTGVWDSISQTLTISHNADNIVPVMVGFTPVDSPFDVPIPSYTCPYTALKTVTAPYGANGESVVVSVSLEKTYQLWVPKSSQDFISNPIRSFSIYPVTHDKVRFVALMTSVSAFTFSSSSSSSSFSSSSSSSSWSSSSSSSEQL